MQIELIADGRLIYCHYFLVLLRCNEWIHQGGQVTGQKEVFSRTVLPYGVITLSENESDIENDK